MPVLLSPFLLPIIALIAVAPDPVAFTIGSLPVYWYGVCYAVGLAATYVVITREARRRGLDARLVDNGIIIVAVAALIGGRLYHVIDEWPRYQDNLLSIVLPPYTGLGVFGGIITGTLAAFVILRFWKQSFWRWADVIAPGIFVMQAIGRWGNFFNQELYGPPTDLPWGITIECQYRVIPYPCATYPYETTGFHPLFLYESVSGIIGAITLLWIARRFGPRMRPGDLFLIWVIWYSAVRFALETLRVDNWTLGGIPTASIMSTLLIVGSLAVMAWRHRPGAASGDRWGEPPERTDDREVDADDEVVEGVEEVEADQVEPASTEPSDEPAATEPSDEPDAGTEPAGTEPSDTTDGGDAGRGDGA